jgi:hypothetical protein
MMRHFAAIGKPRRAQGERGGKLGEKWRKTLGKTVENGGKTAGKNNRMQLTVDCCVGSGLSHGQVVNSTNTIVQVVAMLSSTVSGDTLLSGDFADSTPLSPSFAVASIIAPPSPLHKNEFPHSPADIFFAKSPAKGEPTRSNGVYPLEEYGCW